MKQYYLSTETIRQAYQELTKNNLRNTSILFSFLILKGCGFNHIGFEPLDNISTKGLNLAKRLSWLFAPNEKHPDKCNFINPFNMAEWGSNPKESLEKWIRTRLKNNIIGGATTWRNIINEDLKLNQIKFTYNYLDEIKQLTDIEENKINLIALVIWSNRFTPFSRKATIGDLCKEFLETFCLTKQEQNIFFHTNNTIDLNYQESLHNAREIRALIGKPDITEEWLSVQIVPDQQLREFQEIYQTKVSSMETNSINHVSEEMLLKLLKNYYQVILSGPPGTSKSYLCAQIAKKFDSVRKIQFHPQYSYQQFVGGYVVEKDEVHYKRGVLLNFLEEIKTLEQDNPGKQLQHLLIIDEINRANLSQVFGEVIQCLDRDHHTQIIVDGELEEIKLPKNLYIIGTMNSTDRTLGSVDYALRRRFLNIYCPPNTELLLELCPAQNGISVYDLLKKINENLVQSHKNRELVIGHALFLNENVKNPDDNKYYWDEESLEMLFNYKILPIIEEYCYGNSTQIKSVLGERLPLRLQGEEFIKAIKDFIYK